MIWNKVIRHREEEHGATPSSDDDAMNLKRISKSSLKKLESSNSELLTYFYNVIKKTTSLIESGNGSSTNSRLSNAALTITQAQVNVSRF